FKRLPPSAEIASARSLSCQPGSTSLRLLLSSRLTILIANESQPTDPDVRNSRIRLVRSTIRTHRLPSAALRLRPQALLSVAIALTGDRASMCPPGFPATVSRPGSPLPSTGSGRGGPFAGFRGTMGPSDSCLPFGPSSLGSHRAYRRVPAMLSLPLRLAGSRRAWVLEDRLTREAEQTAGTDRPPKVPGEPQGGRADF